MTSEIRTNSLTSRAGLSTVTLTDSGPMFSGITTFVDNSTFSVGTGGTIHAPATNTLNIGVNNTESLRIDSNSNLKVAGIVTATHFYGNGANLTGLPAGTTINSNTNNYLITGTGTANTLQGEANLTFDGTNLKVGNNATLSDYNQTDILLGDHTGHSGMTILSSPSHGGFIMFSDNNGGGANAYRGQIEYAHSTDYMRFLTASAERLRIDSTGITTITSTSNEEIFRIQTSFGNGGGVQGKAFMGFDHFSVSQKPAILIGSEEEGVASHKGRFVIKLKDAAATDDDPVERLRIDSSGRVSIGDNNAQTIYPFYVAKDLDSGGNLLSFGNTDSTYSQSLTLSFDSSKDVKWAGGSGSGGLIWDMGTRGHVFKINGTEKMRIVNDSATISGTTDGVLNLTTTDSRGSFIRFQQAGTSYNWIGCGQGLGGHNMNDLVLQSQKSIIIKGNAGASGGQSIREIARFETQGTTGGNLLIGTSVFGYQASNNTGHNLYYNENGTANEGFPWYVIVGHTASGGNNFGPWVVNRHSSYGNVRFYVQADGTIRNYGGISSLCDEREKNSIVDAPNAWDYVKNWRMRKFKYNKDGLNPQMKWGIVAQEFEKVNPELVDEEFCTEGNPNVDDTTGEMIFKEQYGDQPPTKRKSVNDRQMMMIAIKALQEAMTKIETLEQENITLRSRVTNLEGN